MKNKNDYISFVFVIFKMMQCFSCDNIESSIRNFTSILESYDLTQNEVVFLLHKSERVSNLNFFKTLTLTEHITRFLTVSEQYSRLAIVTFGYSNPANVQMNYIKNYREHNMCSFLGQLFKHDYESGWPSWTDNPLTLAYYLSTHRARSNANRLVFLIIDGRSSSSYDFEEISAQMKNQGIVIFVIGIGKVNATELGNVASSPYQFFSLPNYEYISITNRKLQRDIVENSWSDAVDAAKCNNFCSKGYNCCDENADCRCGTKGGRYECVCRGGFEGEGSVGHCSQCPKGTFKDKVSSARCVKCPSFSTTSNKGSTSIKDCVCLKGYESHPQNRKVCNIIRCPELPVPSNGVTLPAYCNNTYGSECNFKCNPGYCPRSCHHESLKLNTITQPWHNIPEEPRRCLETRLWSGNDFHCEKMRCPPLNHPEHGYYNCSTLDFTFGTVCSLTCEEDFSLLGSADRHCFINGTWSGEDTICKADLCPPLITNTKLRIKPITCGTTSMEYKSVCQYHCPKGLQLLSQNSNGISVGERRCLLGGKWSNAEEMLTCVDNEPPTITCPPSIHRTTDRGRSFASINWILPSVSDNVAVDSYKIIHPENLKEPPHAFQIGTTKVTYEVRDSSGFTNNCSFFIHILDKEPPRITYCPSDIVKEYNKDFDIQVFWETPEFEDNSGYAYIIYNNINSGANFSRGPVENVIYRVSDMHGNEAICSFSVKIKAYSCPYLDPPVNGFLSCDEGLCETSCKDGYTFLEKVEPAYFCTQTVKKWQKIKKKGRELLKFSLPDCGRIEMLNAIRIPTSATYTTINCDDEVDAIIKANFIEKATSDGFCSPKTSCYIRDVNVTCHFWESNRYEPQNSFGQLNLSYSVEIHASTILEENSIGNCSNCLSDIHITLLRIGYRNAERLLPEMDEIVGDKYKLYRPVYSGSLLENALLCNDGSVLQENKCVVCPIGTYFNTFSKSCDACPKDHYQDEEGSLECKKCPPEKVTLYTKTKALEDCKNRCSPGFFSLTGLEPCLACPKGTYSGIWASKKCDICPFLQTIESALHCYLPCGRGTYSSDGFSPCIKCPQGTYQSKIQATSCTKCPGETTTKKEETDEITFCQTLRICRDFEPCMNGSTCVELERDYKCICAAGFIGKYCHININDCDEEACLNGGTCQDGINDFTCLCAQGFSGSRCEIDNDDCHSDPCQNDGICKDLVNGYSCFCPDGFWGKNCEVNLDECVSSPCLFNGTCFDMKNDFRCCCPKGFEGRSCHLEADNCQKVQCLNGGTCQSTLDGFNCSCNFGFKGEFCEINNNYCHSNTCQNGGTCIDGINDASCLCLDAFSGRYCEIGLPEEFSIKFPSCMTTNYVMLQNAHRLFAITISFFMQTNHVDTGSKETLMSYAFYNPENDMLQDNGITLMKANELMIYIHGQLFHTGYVYNRDFQWHHYALTWENGEGAWTLFVDGDVILSGKDIARGRYLYPGTFILGQDQDDLAGSFSFSESFVGEITEFNVWDYDFNSREVDELKNSCGFQGNVIKWSSTLKHLHGDLVIDTDFNLCRNIGTCSPVSCHCRLNDRSFVIDHACKGYVEDCSINPCKNGQECFENSIYSFCNCSRGFDGRLCEHDIDECLNDNGKCEYICINSIGSYECQCPVGMVLSPDGHSCRETRICKVGNIAYDNGEKWQTKCENCLCDFGNVTCDKKPCSNLTCEESEKVVFPGDCCKSCLSQPSCIVQENNELIAFDGKIHNFEKYNPCVLAENRINGEFSIQCQTQDIYNDKTLCKRNIILWIFCTEVVISSNGLLIVNEKEILLPYEDEHISITMRNLNHIAVATRLGLFVEWSCPGYVRINAPPSFKNQLSGLCGNFNIKSEDHLTEYLPSDTENVLYTV